MTKRIRKVIRYVVDGVSILIVLVSVVLMISVLFTSRGSIPSVMGYSLLRVLTDSMTPKIPADSLIIVKHQEAEKVQVGDVISFYSIDPDLNGMVNTHRVTRVEQQDGSYVMHTKGDANSIEDEYPVDASHLIGKVVWSNQMSGKLVRLVSNPLIFVPIIIAPLVLILILHFRQIIHTTREISKEQEDAYQEALMRVMEQKRKKREQEKEQKEEQNKQEE